MDDSTAEFWFKKAADQGNEGSLALSLAAILGMETGLARCQEKSGLDGPAGPSWGRAPGVCHVELHLVRSHCQPRSTSEAAKPKVEARITRPCSMFSHVMRVM